MHVIIIIYYDNLHLVNLIEMDPSRSEITKFYQNDDKFEINFTLFNSYPIDIRRVHN